MRRGWRIVGLVVLALVASAGLIALALRPPPPMPMPEPGFVLRNVTLVLPGAGGVRLGGQVLTGVGDRIVAMDPVGRVGAQGEGDAFAGHFVMPGLTDMHVHFPPPTLGGQSELFAFLMLAHGITAVRDAADVDGASSAPARDGVEEGRFPGPRIFSCGPIVDGGPPVWGNTLEVDSPEAARAAVRQVAEGGFDCVKTYDRLEAGELSAVRDEAGRHGLRVIGHVPRDVPFESSTLEDAQHLIGVAPDLPGDSRRFPAILDKWASMTDERGDMVIAYSLANGVAHTPTLVTTDRLAASRDYERILAEPELRLLPGFYRNVVWHPDMGLSAAGGMTSADFDMVERANHAQGSMVKRMHEAGVELHTGTDTLIPFIVPGKALHRELRLLHAAGLSAGDVMKLTSVVSARYLGTEGLGTLDVGAPAELVIFRDDPSRDLAALDTISGVVRGGRLYTREMLDAQLAVYQAHYSGTVYDLLVTPIVRRVLASTLENRP